MIIVLAAAVTATAVLHFASASRYADIVNGLDKKEFPLKSILPAGLMIVDTFKLNWSSG